MMLNTFNHTAFTLPTPLYGCGWPPLFFPNEDNCHIWELKFAIFTVVIHDSKCVIQSAVAIFRSPIHVIGGVLSISEID